MTEETLAKFKEKITELHHDLLDWLNGTDTIFDEFVELENFADKELHTHLAEYGEMIGAGCTEEELNALEKKFDGTTKQEDSK